jgi:hypothetical protein
MTWCVADKYVRTTNHYGSDYNITPKPKPQSPLHIKRLGFVQGQVSLVRSIDPAHLTGSFDSSLDLMRDTQQ